MSSIMLPIMLSIAYLGGLFFAFIFLFVIPRWGYAKGKKVNKSGAYGSMSLALGGALFFGYMMFVSYLEQGPLNYTRSGFEGMTTAIISLLGIVAIVLGLVWRLIVGFRKS